MMRHPFKERRLGEILLDQKVLSKEQLDLALSEGGDAALGTRLVEAGIIESEQLAVALSEQFNIPYVDLNNFTVNSELFELLPGSYAYQYDVVPYKREDGHLYIAFSDPFDLTIGDKLERICALPVRLVLSTSRLIAEVLKRSQGSSEVLKDVAEDFRMVVVKETDEGREETVSLNDDDTGPVVKLVNSILVAALQRRASDIHIETYEKAVIVKYRIDGVLYPATDRLDRSHQGTLISRLKVIAELDIAEKRAPQDGRFKLRVSERDIDFRVSILPGIFGEDAVIRILDKSSIADGVDNLSLERLGYQAEEVKNLRKAIHEPHGLVLITGPTGSGKTTTLYAALSELNKSEEKVITIEDPVEYQLDGIVQIPVNEAKGLTFAEGLRSILRHDPDKIMVGEIRDSDTAQIAVQSALTGHLVFTTVHANNAFDIINRFSHMGIDIYNFVTSLNCVMAQRLVRNICSECKQEVSYDTEFLESSGLDPEQYSGAKWYEGEGCEQCASTGYRGRTAITEFLHLSPKVREMIIRRSPASELQQVAINEGMTTLRESALMKATAGETSLKEINRVTFID